MTANLALVPPTAATDTFPPGPLWTWPRPAETPAHLRPGKGPAVEVIYHRLGRLDGDRTPTVLHPAIVGYGEHSRYFAATEETRDPAWWRDRLPGVAYAVHLWPEGMPTKARPKRPRVHLGSIGPHEDPAPLLVVAPDAVRVTITGVDTFPAMVAPDGAYTLALPPALTMALRKVRDTLRAAVPPKVSDAREALMAKVRARTSEGRGARGGERG